MAGEVCSASTILKAFGLKPEWKKYQLRITARRNGWSTKVEGGCGSPITGNSTSALAEPALREAKPDLENPKGRFGHMDNLWIVNWPTDQAAYAPGTKVMLKLAPATGKTFHHWADFDGLVPKDTPPSLIVAMDGHRWVDLSYEMESDGATRRASFSECGSCVHTSVNLDVWRDTGRRPGAGEGGRPCLAGDQGRR
jgi:hypothetical protein